MKNLLNRLYKFIFGEPYDIEAPPPRKIARRFTEPLINPKSYCVLRESQ